MKVTKELQRSGSCTVDSMRVVASSSRRGTNGMLVIIAFNLSRTNMVRIRCSSRSVRAGIVAVVVVIRIVGVDDIGVVVVGVVVVVADVSSTAQIHHRVVGLCRQFHRRSAASIVVQHQGRRMRWRLLLLLLGRRNMVLCMCVCMPSSSYSFSRCCTSSNGHPHAECTVTSTCHPRRTTHQTERGGVLLRCRYTTTITVAVATAVVVCAGGTDHCVHTVSSSCLFIHPTIVVDWVRATSLVDFAVVSLHVRIHVQDGFAAIRRATASTCTSSSSSC